MPKIKELTTEEKIVAHLEENGQMLSWLAEKVGVTVGHLHSILKGKDGVKRTLTEENLIKINEALKTNFQNN